MRDVSRYTIDGRRVPSVTEILEMAGLIDLTQVPIEALQRKRRIGQRVHQWLELYDLGVLDDVPPDDDYTGYVAAYHRFRNESGFAPELIEHVVTNKAYLYCGTLDRTGKLNGKQVLIDLKVEAQLSKPTRLQTMGYELCLTEPHDRYALQLRPDATYRLEAYTDRTDHHDWLACVRLAHWRLRHGLTRIP